MNQPKRENLKKITSQYQNVLFPNSNTGHVRISIRKRLDDRFEKELQSIGVKIYQNLIDITLIKKHLRTTERC